MHRNLWPGTTKLKECNEKRTQTSARKKSGEWSSEITALIFMAGDGCGNKPSGVSQFSACFMIPSSPHNWSTAVSLLLVRQDPWQPKLCELGQDVQVLPGARLQKQHPNKRWMLVSEEISAASTASREQAAWWSCSLHAPGLKPGYLPSFCPHCLGKKAKRIRMVWVRRDVKDQLVPTPLPWSTPSVSHWIFSSRGYNWDVTAHSSSHWSSHCICSGGELEQFCCAGSSLCTCEPSPAGTAVMDQVCLILSRWGGSRSCWGRPQSVTWSVCFSTAKAHSLSSVPSHSKPGIPSDITGACKQLWCRETLPSAIIFLNESFQFLVDVALGDMV